MAIIDAIRGLEVRVIVNGAPLQEYSQTPDDNDDSDSQVTRYIVAEPGKEFKVEIIRKQNFQFGAPQWDVALWSDIDGKAAKGALIPKNDPQYVRKTLEHVNVDLGKGKWGTKNFMFSDLALDNTEAVPTSAKQVEEAKAMGEIKIIFKRGTIGESLPPTSVSGINFKAGGKMHEKALKGRAMSRQAGLAETKVAAAPSVSRFEVHDREPFATFKFLYRSMRDLKAEMIVPRSPSPVPLDEIPDSDLTREQLLERLNDARAKAARVKTEGMRIKRERTVGANGEYDDDDDEDGIEVVDPPPKRAKVIESIDLTED